jgi:hypothetical protein
MTKFMNFKSISKNYDINHMYDQIYEDFVGFLK